MKPWDDVKARRSGKFELKGDNYEMALIISIPKEYADPEKHAELHDYKKDLARAAAGAAESLALDMVIFDFGDIEEAKETSKEDWESAIKQIAEWPIDTQEKAIRALLHNHPEAAKKTIRFLYNDNFSPEDRAFLIYMTTQSPLIKDQK